MDDRNEFYDIEMASETEGSAVIQVKETSKTVLLVVASVPEVFQGQQTFSYQVKIDAEILSCSNPQYPGETQVTKNNLLTTIPNWGPTWKITFELLIKSFPTTTEASILHFTTGNRCCDVGDRIPFLQIYNKDVLVVNAVNGNGNYYINSYCQPNEKCSFIISQSIEDDQVILNK